MDDDLPVPTALSDPVGDLPSFLIDDRILRVTRYDLVTNWVCDALLVFVGYLFPTIADSMPCILVAVNDHND